MKKELFYQALDLDSRISEVELALEKIKEGKAEPITNLGIIGSVENSTLKTIITKHLKKRLSFLKKQFELLK